MISLEHLQLDNFNELSEETFMSINGGYGDPGLELFYQTLQYLIDIGRVNP